MKSRIVDLCTSLLLILILVSGVSVARADSDDGIVRVKSAVSMGEAITRIKTDIAGKGIKFFIEIDQSKLAADAGIKLRPSTLLVFGNPPLGTQFITSNPNAGLDWPVRLLLTQDDNGEGCAVWTDFEWIESHDRGGTCPNRGCTPKKVLVAAGHALHEIERAAIHHISVGKPKPDWSALIDREKDLIKDIPANLARSMARRDVEVIKGHAAFAGPNAIRVGDRRLEAKHLVIATGSKPRQLPIPGAEHMITSDEMLSERELPGSVIFVGGGVISLEFGHVYARAGARVTILEALLQLLPAMDADAVAHLQTESQRIGISVKTNVSVKQIERANGRLRVVFTHEGAEHSAEADRVVNGAGRIANVDTLDLASGKVEHSNGRVAADAHLRSTSHPQDYVCGDAVPISPQLSPI